MIIPIIIDNELENFNLVEGKISNSIVNLL
jgi:hypothetical protein